MPFTGQYAKCTFNEASRAAQPIIKEPLLVVQIASGIRPKKILRKCKGLICNKHERQVWSFSSRQRLIEWYVESPFSHSSTHYRLMEHSGIRTAAICPSVHSDKFIFTITDSHEDQWKIFLVVMKSRPGMWRLLDTDMLSIKSSDTIWKGCLIPKSFCYSSPHVYIWPWHHCWTQLFPYGQESIMHYLRNKSWNAQ